MYKRVALIGDSLSVGTYSDINASSFGPHRPLSWLNNLAKRNGFEPVWYGYGGITTRTWLSNNDPTDGWGWDEF